MDALSEVLAIADELYGVLPEAFTAARDDCVRDLRRDGAAARALAVKEFRRPSVAAWLVNALVRHRPDEMGQLLRIGEALRSAQDTLDADQLRDLNRKRQAVVAAIGRQARALARELGRPVSESVAAEVEGTLRAALSDPAAASAVRSGRLTTSLRYAGFGDADVPDAVALPSLNGSPGTALAARTGSTRAVERRSGAGRTARPHEVDPSEVEPQEVTARVSARDAAIREARLSVQAAEEAAHHSQGVALVAEQHRDDLRRRAGIARDRLDKAHARVADLESQLSAARVQASTAAAAWAPVHAEADAAAVRAEAARGVAERARAILASTRAHLADVERPHPSA